jgi:hypothetical protein
MAQRLSQLVVQRVGEADTRVIQRVTCRGFHQRDDFRVVQTGQLDARHAALPTQRSQGLKERLRA